MLENLQYSTHKEARNFRFSIDSGKNWINEYTFFKLISYGWSVYIKKSLWNKLIYNISDELLTVMH